MPNEFTSLSACFLKNYGAISTQFRKTRDVMFCDGSGNENKLIVWCRWSIVVYHIIFYRKLFYIYDPVSIKHYKYFFVDS